jgi:carboxyl-terminal processing protease
MRRPLVLAVTVVALVASLAAGIELGRGQRAAAPVAMPRTLDQVREALADGYYRTVPQSVLAQRSVSAMIAALRDPYTAYLGAPEYRLLRHETASSYSGVGIGILPSAGGLVVVSLRPGPASRAGVRIGDTIVRIGDRPVSRLDMSHVVAGIAGPVGTRVSLEVRRANRDLTFTMRRAVVHAPVVDARLLSFAGRTWGVLRLSAFSFGAAPVLARELRLLQRQGAAGFVLDLRDNPGGLLAQAVGVSSLFLHPGAVVVSLVGQHRPRQVLRTGLGPVTGLPLAVLVDRYSASSAEIVAAALQDHRRATLVGERTFGKALVQAVDPLGNGDALELTVARYFTPFGADISHGGVVPQIHALDDPRTSADEGLTAALRALARPAG